MVTVCMPAVWLTVWVMAGSVLVTVNIWVSVPAMVTVSASALLATV